MNIFEQHGNFVFTHAHGRVIDRAQRVIDERPPTARLAAITIAAGHEHPEALSTHPNLEELLTGPTREAWARKELGAQDITIAPARWGIDIAIRDLTWEPDEQTRDRVSLLVIAYCPGGIGREHDHYALPLTAHALGVTPDGGTVTTSTDAVFRGVVRPQRADAGSVISRLMRGYR